MGIGEAGLGEMGVNKTGTIQRNDEHIILISR